MQQSEKLQSAQEQGVESSNNADSTDQYLTFIVAGEEYGVDILRVQEIRGWESATPLPNAPKHIKGVINLRGTIVPITDLRSCFGLPQVEYSPITVVIVLKVHGEKASRTVGVVVDAVSDVHTLAKEQMRAAPEMGETAATEAIRGLASVNDKMVILLDMDKLLKLEVVPEMAELSQNLKTQA